MENLKILRKEKGLTQEDMAKVLNVSRVTYSRYERGIYETDNNTLIKLSKFFNVSVDYLLGLIEIPLSSQQAMFMKKLQQEDDPSKITDEFEVQLGGRTVTGAELIDLMKTMKKLDEVVNGDFFKKKDN